MTEVGLEVHPPDALPRPFTCTKDTPPERVKWLQWAFSRRAYYTQSYQDFNNESKFMDLIPSFRDTEGAKTADQRDHRKSTDKTYKEMGLI